MSKIGRKSKFTDTIKTISLNLASQGKTNKEIAEIIDVSEATFQRWIAKDSEFKEELRTKKSDYDVKLVESSLLDRCLGQTITEKRTRKDKEGNVLDIQIIEKEIPADIGALKLFLTNRAPDRFATKGMEIEVTSNTQLNQINFNGMTLREIQEYNSEHNPIDCIKS